MHAPLDANSGLRTVRHSEPASRSGLEAIERWSTADAGLTTICSPTTRAEPSTMRLKPPSSIAATRG